MGMELFQWHQSSSVTFGCCWEPQGIAVSLVGLFFICVPVDTSYNHLWGN